MKRIPELGGFFEEIIKRFNCSKNAQQKYNRVMSKIVERMAMGSAVEYLADDIKIWEEK